MKQSIGKDCCILLCILACTSTIMHAQVDDGSTLDNRIDPTRITRSPAAEASGTIMQPLPATLAIASSADEASMDAATYDDAVNAINKGIAYLAKAQAGDGSWMTEVVEVPTDQPQSPAPVTLAVTAMGIKALTQSGHLPDSSPACLQAVRFIQAILQQPDMLQELRDGPLGNYVTAAMVSAFSSFDELRYREIVQDGVLWLKQNQWTNAQGLEPDMDWYGGAGYGKRGRPDLSNTQVMLDALHDAGVSPDDPAVQAALVFVSRTQNIPSNRTTWSINGDKDGGFIYTPANGGESLGSEAAGDGRWGELIPEGTPRSLKSYGSMTYAGFKSLLYAGLTSDDPRVKAAFDWIRSHWSFQENPGLGQQGLYYYYHAMARALHATQQLTITDDGGEVHDWRAELIDALVQKQKEDGSWVNPEDRWSEGHPELVTIYSILALQEAIKPVAGR